MKRPSFQFYAGDWQANSNLRRCSHEEKGIWIDVMCILHSQNEYGLVRWPLKEIAQAVGSNLSKIKGLVNKGVLKGVDAGQKCEKFVFVPRSGRKDGAPIVILDSQDGPIWYSTRMLLDEYKSSVRGNNTPDVTPDNSPKPPIGECINAENNAPKVTPSHASASLAAPSSSSSSSSSSSIKPLNPTSQPDAGAGRLERFSMHLGWEPSGHVADLARQSGVEVTQHKLAEFLVHWLTEPKTARTQAEWDKALLQSAMHDKLHLASLQVKSRAQQLDNFAEKDYGKGGKL
jgi:hypothetical protein